MSYLHRAFFYVTRKYTKSLLLLLILLALATLALSGLAVKDAAKTAQLNVRQALGGMFSLQQNKNDPDKWVSTNVGQYGSTSYYGGAPLTEELAEYIQKNVKGIAGCSAGYTSYTVPAGKNGSILKLIESDDGGSGMGSLLAGYGDFNSTVSTYASTNTAYDSYFSGGYLELVEGQHFTTEDRNPALLSKTLAEENGLKLGDEITLRMSSFKASMMGYDADKTCVSVTIVGLFQATAKSTASLSNWSMDNSVFTTLDVVRAARPDMGEEGYEKISFYVTDPAEIDRVVKEVRALPDLDPSDFLVSVDSSSADAVMAPLKNMDRLVSLLLVLVLGIGALLLYLVLSARVKERVHESGVLLSLGLSPWNITAQYLAECLLIAVLAFSLSVFSSRFLANAVGEQLLDYTISGSVQPAPSAAGADVSKDGVYLGTSDDFAPQFEGRNKLTQIQVSITPHTVAAMYGIGFFLVCAAVLAAALPVLRKKPREIVSEMN